MTRMSRAPLPSTASRSNPTRTTPRLRLAHSPLPRTHSSAGVVQGSNQPRPCNYRTSHTEKVNTMRKIAITTVAIAGVALMALSGCSARSESGSASDASGFKSGSTIGVALPDKTSENWVLAGKLFTDGLEKAGFKADVQYAPSDNTASEQASQISTMNTKGAKVLNIGAFDGKQLGAQVKAAHDNGAKVIAYDRIIQDSKNVDYYVAYNNEKVGELQGQALLDGMKERFPDAKSYNIELFSGAATDPNAKVFFDGAMKVLQPKIDDGTLKVVSGQTEISKTQ